MDYKNPRIEKVKDAAEAVPTEPPQMKEQPGRADFAGRIGRNDFTPPGPAGDQHARIFAQSSQLHR